MTGLESNAVLQPQCFIYMHDTRRASQAELQQRDAALSAALAAQQLELQRKIAALQEVSEQLSGALSDSLSSLAAAKGESRELQAGLSSAKRQNSGWQRHCRGLALRLSQTQALLVDQMQSASQLAALKLAMASQADGLRRALSDAALKQATADRAVEGMRGELVAAQATAAACQQRCTELLAALAISRHELELQTTGKS